MTEEKQRLEDLLEYAKHVGRLNEKATFSIAEYSQLAYFEYQLKGRIGVHHDVVGDGVSIWLKVEHLARINAPTPMEPIVEWLTISNDPYKGVEITEQIIKTLTDIEAQQLVDNGIVDEKDVIDHLKETRDHVKRKDVIFRLENQPELKEQISQYINEPWLIWAESEKPRRDTIKIYDNLFYLQQALDAQGDEKSLELVWGIGVSRWNVENRNIDHPIIEKFVEIELDNDTGALLIMPRSRLPELEVAAYLALDNLGADKLHHFYKKHLLELPEDVEFSPYISQSFESVLKQAARVLCESGIYWPEINSDIDNRKPPATGDTLNVTDSWVIYARERRATNFVQDIERFKQQLEHDDFDEINSPSIQLVSRHARGVKNRGFGVGGNGDAGSSSSTPKPDEETELFFPKPFNDAQVKIVERLNNNDGVVVQGPPGTGKTHTIANIISHYLATGKRVLVTSKGKPALEVLREQIPEELRELTISLLSNEREGFKQLESAVTVLSSIASQTDLGELKNNAKSLKLRVDQLKKQILAIDCELREWGEKQLSPIRAKLACGKAQLTAMELAEMVVKNRSQHEWFPDELGAGDEFTPQIFDADVAKLREARREIGNKLSYVNKCLPSLNDFPESAQFAAIHEDLVNAQKIKEQAQVEQLPQLSVSVENAISRAEALKPKIAEVLTILDSLDERSWLREIFDHWCVSGIGGENTFLFDELLPDLKTIVESRVAFIRQPVAMEDPSIDRIAIDGALVNLSCRRSAFGLFSFGHANAKTVIEQVKVSNATPSRTEDWEHVINYLSFQDAVNSFIVKWNSVGIEYGLPELVYIFSNRHNDLDILHKTIERAIGLVADDWQDISAELSVLFPHGLKVAGILKNKEEANRTIRTIEVNTSRIHLEAQRHQIEDAINKLCQCNGEVVDELKIFFTKVGNKHFTSPEILSQWNILTAELRRLYTLDEQFKAVERITDLISESGAKKWANLLATVPYEDNTDDLTPSYWYESWIWRQQESYIKNLDARDRLKAIIEQRSKLDLDLNKSFSNLVRVKTSIGLHSTLSNRVQSALARFVSAVSKIGKGTGKRAPRHRRDAFRAMEDCYDGVPCWIMPTWRVSEALPSEFGSFDLVIIDEASQSDISALPVIMRAKKLLVVGDDKQVSPSAGFVEEEKILQLRHNFLRDQPFAELLLPGNSMYDLASAVFPSQRIVLTEHFRCVEPIISFSMQFYNESLLPLRIPKQSERLDPPLIDVYVPHGSRDERKKINEAEIDVIVDEIKLLVDSPAFINRTIGVISLIGAQQAHAIQEQLLQEIGEAAYVRHSISCGDSAVFQGKEKDIIFLSMVVGAKQGTALTKREYEQRFNVALSRARDRMYLVRSICDDDLNNKSDLRLRVIRHFQNPMPQMQEIDNLIELCDSGFERDVFTRLVEKGYCVTPQVKVGKFSIDLVVEGENDRRLAIELDGDKYHPPEQWKDDFTRQRTMERVGWTFWRCWGSTYQIDPEGCLEDLTNTLDYMGIAPSGVKSKRNIYTEFRRIKLEEAEEIIDVSLVSNHKKQEELMF